MMAFLCGCVFGACGLVAVLHFGGSNRTVGKLVKWITHCSCPLPGSVSSPSTHKPTH